MSSQRLLIRNGFVVTLDPDIGDLPNADVLIEDGRIMDIGRAIEVGTPTCRRVPMIVMPGFIDTHRHTWQTRC